MGGLPLCDAILLGIQGFLLEVLDYIDGHLVEVVVGFPAPLVVRFVCEHGANRERRNSGISREKLYLQIQFRVDKSNISPSHILT